jgi:alpha-D-xyloside xylohydrolase
MPFCLGRSQRYGAAVWSGDITSTFEALQAQVHAGLNMGLSGIPWWTTDRGIKLGVFNGEPSHGSQVEGHLTEP